MRTLVTATLATVAVSLLLPGPLTAQEEMPEAEKRENATWYVVVHVDYKPGKEDQALDLIRNQYLPAVRQTEDYPGPAMTLVHQTGGWDLTLVWEMTRGPSGLEWETTPEDAAFQKQFMKMAGKEKAQKISDQYSSYVARSKATITYQPADLMP